MTFFLILLKLNVERKTKKVGKEKTNKKGRDASVTHLSGFVLSLHLLRCVRTTSMAESSMYVYKCFVTILHNLKKTLIAFRPGLFRACELPKLKNGVVRLRQRGRLAMFTCRSPFILHGDRYASCISGRWDVPSPACISKSFFPEF